MELWLSDLRKVDDTTIKDILKEVAEERGLSEEYMDILYEDLIRGLSLEVQKKGVLSVQIPYLGYLYKAKAKLMGSLMNPSGITKAHKDALKAENISDIEAIRYFEDQMNPRKSSAYWGHSATQLDARYRKFLTKEEKDTVNNPFRWGSRHETKLYNLIQKIQNSIYEQE